MELWDQDFIDLVQPGQIQIRSDATGSLQFGGVEAEIDCKVEDCGGAEKLEFTFEGSDEGDHVSGRGWARLQGNEMRGRIYFHLGDDSGFSAVRMGQ